MTRKILKIIFLIVIGLFMLVSGTYFVENKITKRMMETSSARSDTSTVLCNDCHIENFKPQIIGEKFYYGNWKLNTEYLAPVIDTVADTIFIYPDKFRLPDSLELSILIDASHGHSLKAKYIQQWAVTTSAWLKLGARNNDWVMREDVAHRIK